jgi:hypothetical protein
MFAETLACLVLVLGVAFGLGQPLVSRLPLAPAEALVAGVGLSLIGAWLVAWAVFTTGLPLSLYWLLPALAAAGMALSWPGLRRMAGDPVARDLASGQLIVTLWCVGCLAFVRAYSGGAWIGDWVEHWQRAHYFLRAWPAGTPFYDIYELPARPPLANVLTATFLLMVRPVYADYQVIMATLSSLAYLPTGLLASRYGGRAAARMAVVLVLVSPLFLQNATYPWTKLPAAFFILAGLYFYLRVRDGDGSPRVPGLLCAVLLGGAIVTHYSAGPYVAVLAAAWIAEGFRRRWDGPFAAATAAAAGAGACILAPWFLWSIARYGAHSTFLSNTSVTALDRVQGSHLLKVALNLRDTVIPAQLRGFHGRLFSQSSPWGALRDQCFLLYQINLPLALGCVGGAAVARESWREARSAAPADRWFWGLALAGFVVLSVAVYADREHYGIVHICLQSVVLLGLAFLAARWERLGRAWRIALAVGWAVDVALGIALQLSVESFALDRWVHPAQPLGAAVASYSLVSQENMREKVMGQLSYVADVMPAPPALALGLLAALFALALARARPAAAGRD